MNASYRLVVSARSCRHCHRRHGDIHQARCPTLRGLSLHISETTRGTDRMNAESVDLNAIGAAVILAAITITGLLLWTL